MFAGKVHDLRHFGLRHFICIDPAFADSLMMHMQHNSRRGFVILAEETFQHVHDEFHRRVIVVEDEHAVHVRPLGLRLGLANDRGARSALITLALAVVVRHAGRSVAERDGGCLPMGEGGLFSIRRHDIAEASSIVGP